MRQIRRGVSWTGWRTSGHYQLAPKQLIVDESTANSSTAGSTSPVPWAQVDQKLIENFGIAYASCR